MAFTPNHIEVPVGDRLIIDFTNSGDQRHDLVFETGVSSDRSPRVKQKELDLWRHLRGRRGLVFPARTPR